MSTIDHFEYGTFEMIENDKGDVTKRVGHRYGHLALVRVEDGIEAAAGDVPPGTIAGLNGYTKQ